MKRAKRLSILVAVLVVVCAAAIVVTQLEERQEQIQATGEIVLEIDSDAVTALSWTYEDTSLAFHKDDIWRYDDDDAFPVDQEKIGELLAPFASFGVSFVIEEVTDFGMYGLEEPLCTISLTTQEQDYTITLGEFSELDEERYVSIGDGNVYLRKPIPWRSTTRSSATSLTRTTLSPMIRCRPSGLPGRRTTTSPMRRTAPTPGLVMTATSPRTAGRLCPWIRRWWRVT